MILIEALTQTTIHLTRISSRRTDRKKDSKTCLMHLSDLSTLVKCSMTIGSKTFSKMTCLAIDSIPQATLRTITKTSEVLLTILVGDQETKPSPSNNRILDKMLSKIDLEICLDCSLDMEAVWVDMASINLSKNF
jgi:hypothetical protein